MAQAMRLVPVARSEADNPGGRPRHQGRGEEGRDQPRGLHQLPRDQEEDEHRAGDHRQTFDRD